MGITKVILKLNNFKSLIVAILHCCHSNSKYKTFSNYSNVYIAVFSLSFADEGHSILAATAIFQLCKKDTSH